MHDKRLQFGDSVRHLKRPEWGVGSVIKVENVIVDGARVQRVSIRFPNAGLKMLSTSHAELEKVENNVAMSANTTSRVVEDLDRLNTNGWLGEHAGRKITEVMTTLPEMVRDPFRTPADRLSITLGLYRFDRTGGGLVDWAVAQSGLDDPLSRFSRQELEQFFDRWAVERDDHLIRVVKESSLDDRTLRIVFEKAPEAARVAVRRVGALT